MNTKQTLMKSITTLILLLGIKLALAALPTTLNYQGHLTDASGDP